MMMLNVQIGDIGLALDLTGAAILFVYGLAPLLSKDGSMSLSVGNSNYLKRKARTYEIRSRVGILLIVAGFATQLVGNHIDWSVDLGVTALLGMGLAFLVASVVAHLVRRYWSGKYELNGHYLPQFNEKEPSHNGKQMWSFNIKNNSNKVLKNATLRLSVKPSTVSVLTEGEAPETRTPSKRIELSEIEPKKLVTVQVWNIGGHITAGLDCSLEVGERIIRPNISGFEEDEL